MRTAVIIPARFGSSRFPGKPLVPILGTPLLHRVIAIGQRSGADEVCVATDDARIAECARLAGVQALMTDSSCRNGSERVHAAVKQLACKPDIVINLQGDAVLTPPWVVHALIDAMQEGSGPDAATPAVALDWEQYAALKQAKASGNTSGTLVVFDSGHRALYFSRSIIPHLREESRDKYQPVYRHIGLYAYTRAALERYLRLPPSPLEGAEQLEQLRMVEAGMELRVVPVDYRGRTHWAVDTEADVKIVEDIIRREGELTEA